MGVVVNDVADVVIGVATGVDTDVPANTAAGVD